MLKTQFKPLVGAILTRFGPDVLYAFFAVYVITWLQAGNSPLTNQQALTATMTAGFIQVFTMPFAGWLSDRVDRRLLYAVACVLGAIWTFVFIWMLQERNFGLAVFGVVVGLLTHSFMYAPQAAHIAEQFHARLRYTGSSLAYTFAGIFAGGLAPTMFAIFWANGQNSWAIAAYIAAACVITLIGLAMGKAVVDDVDDVLVGADATAEQAK